MNTLPFEIVPHTADIAMAIRGRDMAELLTNAALALYSILLGTHGPTEQTERTVVVDSVDRDTLLIDWLNELIYLADAEQLAFARFDIACLTDNKATVRCYGHPVDDTLHRLARDVKAATYHMAQIETSGDGLSACVIFDI